MQITGAEWKVMGRVWRSHPASARDVFEDLRGETEWAYTTVKTMLDRLVEKGALAVRKRGNTGLYEPLVTKDDARRSAVRHLIEKAFDGAFGPLMHFLVDEERLSRKERDQLILMLKTSQRSRSPK